MKLCQLVLIIMTKKEEDNNNNILNKKTKITAFNLHDKNKDNSQKKDKLEEKEKKSKIKNSINSTKNRNIKFKSTKMLNDKFTVNKKLSIEGKNDIIEKGFNAFKAENEWDMFLQILITSFISILPKDVFNDFDKDYSLYIFNNLTKIEKSKEYKNLCKKPIKNEKLYKQMLEFFKERNNKFAISKNKYRDESNKNSINNEEEIEILCNNKSDKNNNDILKALNINGLKDFTNKNDIL